MHIHTDVLKAFLEINQSGSFTKAAHELGISQPALSQKIATLEDRLHAAVFIRRPEGILLTSAGEKLVIFAKQQLQMEKDFLQEFNQYAGQLTGVFRLAGFSSVVISVLMPSLAPWLRENRGVNLELSSHEVVDLERILKSNMADCIVTDYFPELPGVEEIKLGEEEYVLIESSEFPDSPDFFLDHGPHDNATESFFKFHQLPMNIRRGFMGDVYGILEGVAQGLGKAVMSKHLIKGDPRFRMSTFSKRYTRPVVLSFYRQSYYSPVHRSLIEILQKRANVFL